MNTTGGYILQRRRHSKRTSCTARCLVFGTCSSSIAKDGFALETAQKALHVADGGWLDTGVGQGLPNNLGPEMELLARRQVIDCRFGGQDDFKASAAMKMSYLNFSSALYISLLLKSTFFASFVGQTDRPASKKF